MSDAKKAGSRDISELKQRLGLKKGGAAQPAAGGRSNGAPSGGVVAPPGLAVPQAPPQPAAPNAHDDPFGAMNHMAAVAQVQRAPEKEYIVVNDGNVEKVHAASHGALIAKIAVPAGIALIVGIAIGKIGTGASNYNEGLRGARVVLGDKTSGSTVAMLKKQLSDLDNLLDEAKTKNGFKPSLELDKKLKEAAAKLEVKTEVVFRAKQIDPELSGQVLSFYAGVLEVKDMIDIHNKAAAGDDIMLKKAKDAADKAATDDVPGGLRFAVLLSAPTETDRNEFGAKLVEIAGVYCGAGNNPVSRCPEGEFPSAYAYRNEPGATPIKGDLVPTGSDTLPGKKIVPLLSNGVRDSFIKGGEPTISEIYYTKRLRALYDRIHGKVGQDGKPQGGLIEDGNKLETRLTTEAGKSTRFSFFM
ncbi:MAG TPA: hypothetical protein VFV99_23740 [Kofleriaceae bacterium]|nr:hypothetical protein [Kofleriaceae bacterium]